jgi:diguanylate cyclase (GGDEF)-like protein/PAS domain S-box-containing protein
MLFPCAWYTYALFDDMAQEELTSSFDHNTQLKHLKFELQLQSATDQISQVKTRLDSLSSYNVDNTSSIITASTGNDSIIEYHWLSPNSHQLDASFELMGSKSKVSFIRVPLSTEGATDYQGMTLFFAQGFLGIRLPIESKGQVVGRLFSVVNLAYMFERNQISNILLDGVCVRFFSPKVRSSSKLLYGTLDTTSQCKSDDLSLVQVRYQINWLDQVFTLSFTDARLSIDEKPLSFSHILAVLLVLISGLIVFYVYRSRRYEYKIESLLKERGQSLKDVRVEYSKLFMLSVDGIYRASLTGNLLKANPAYASAFGYQDEAELCAKVNDIGAQLHQNSLQYSQFIEQLKDEKRVVGFEWQSQDMSGRSIWLLENAYLTQHENGEVYYEGFISDITQKKKAELALKNQAQMDSLTGLLNRETFVNRVSTYIEHNSAHNSAIFFIDLDKFKTVNDQYGHHVGDELLIEFSRRLKACFMNEDMISRLGGDEFSVFLRSVKNLPRLHELADKVVAGLRKPFAFSNGYNFKISASIGISMLDSNVKNASEGLKQADMAMYEVKRNGRADFFIFNQGLNETERRRSLLEKSLLTALKHSEINIHYQPIVCFVTGKIKGMEALMRWQNDLLGDVSPVEFIPIAEQINLINPFSNWLIHQVCHDLKGLIDASGNQNLFVSINISPKQLLSDQVCDNLLISIELNQLKPKNIKLEITETAIYDQEESVVKQLRRIRSYGIGIYIDDFGTGYSSLERLIQYPFDGLKIDRSFVKNLVPGNSQDVILKASVKMAEMLNLVVVVEGIESHFQYDFFKNLACEFAQGFLLFKPLTVADLTQILVKEFNGNSQKKIDETIS